MHSHHVEIVGGCLCGAVRYQSKKPPIRGFYCHCTMCQKNYAECGSPLLFTYEGNPDAWVVIGSLDHPENWPLTKDASWGQIAHVHVDAKVPWYVIHDGLPQRTSETTPIRDNAMKHAAAKPAATSNR
jgi:hypothetical protein